MRPRYAVIGTGAAGLAAAWHLHRSAPVTPHLTLYERSTRAGGHAWTVHLPDGPDAGLPLDIGFMIMNEHRYPTMSRMLSELPGIALRESEMSFSYMCRASTDSYAINHTRHSAGASAGMPRVSAQGRPRQFGRLLEAALRFGRIAREDLDSGRLGNETLGEYLEARRIDNDLRDRYIVPMGAALWSSPPGRIVQFPARSYLRFLDNHGLLALNDALTWRHIAGGSRRYVDALLGELADAQLRLAARVDAVVPESGGVLVRATRGTEQYDGVIIAAHADQACALFEEAGDYGDRQALRAIGYQSNDAVLHWDESVMPADRACWAAWNYEREASPDADRVCVSYCLNRLQGHVDAARTYFVTLNRRQSIDERKVIMRTQFRHPIFDTAAIRAQQSLNARSGNPRIQLAGSYFGYGFHEDAMASGVAAADALMAGGR